MNIKNYRKITIFLLYLKANLKANHRFSVPSFCVNTIISRSIILAMNSNTVRKSSAVYEFLSAFQQINRWYVECILGYQVSWVPIMFDKSVIQIRCDFFRNIFCGGTASISYFFLLWTFFDKTYFFSNQSQSLKWGIT